MAIIATLIGIAGGLLAMSSLLAKRAPNAAEALAKLAPYQGSIGIIMFFWGVWELIHAVTGIGALSTAPLLWIFGLVSGIADFSVGLLLGFGLVSTYVFRGNAQAIEKGAMLRDKLAAFQVPLGALAILVSVAYGALYYV
jgi:hypothetical protein